MVQSPSARRFRRRRRRADRGALSQAPEGRAADMSEEVLIRPATGADAAAVGKIVDDAYERYVARIGKKPGPMLDDYPARIAEGAVSVVTVDGAVAGVLVLLPEPDHLLLDNV